MQETQTIPRTKMPDQPKRQANKLVRTIATSIIISLLLGGLFGAWAVRSQYTPPMQGNEACKGAMIARDKQLQATLNEQFGTPKPEGTPSLEDVKVLQEKCDSTYESYVVNVSTEATK